MKVDISKKIITLDNQKLSGEIAKYESVSNQTAYLFMSQGTMKALSDLIVMNVKSILIVIFWQNIKGAKYFGMMIWNLVK